MVKKSEDWLLKCPVCAKKMWFTNIAQHRRLKHSEISMNEFEAMIIAKITKGKLVPKHFEDKNPGNSINSSTQAIRKSIFNSKSNKPFQGGRGK